MFELPLFPLNTVLFPGMPLRLHIFEERYKRLVQRCLQDSKPFGVLLIKHGREAGGPFAEPHTIGCTAQITEVEPLDDGRFNLMAFGLERFMLHEIVDVGTPYLVGNVDLLPLPMAAPDKLLPAMARLQPWVMHYMQVLGQATEMQDIPDATPREPLGFIYFAAMLLQAPLGDKQHLLMIDDSVALLDVLLTIYRRETALLRALLELPESGWRPDAFLVN